MKAIAAWLLAAAALAAVSGCARPDWIEQTLVTVNVAGSWHGTSPAGVGGTTPPREIWLDLHQLGPKVTGSVRLRVGGGTGVSFANGPIEGTVAGDVLTFTGGPVRGAMTVSEDEMTGRLNAFPFALRRVASKGDQ